MKKCIALLVVALIATVVFLPRGFEATAVPEEGLRVTYTVKSMFSFQSDWNRHVTVEYGTNKIQKVLYKDTGWWRGSHLYRHKSGVYMIHEGQQGCFRFTVEPLSFDVRPLFSCEKKKGAQLEQNETSRYYTDMTYLGAFIETPNSLDGAPISFVSVDKRPEVELPSMI